MHAKLYSDRFVVSFIMKGIELPQVLLMTRRDYLCNF